MRPSQLPVIFELPGTRPVTARRENLPRCWIPLGTIEIERSIRAGKISGKSGRGRAGGQAVPGGAILGTQAVVAGRTRHPEMGRWHWRTEGLFRSQTAYELPERPRSRCSPRPGSGTISPVDLYGAKRPRSGCTTCLHALRRAFVGATYCTAIGRLPVSYSGLAPVKLVSVPGRDWLS